MIRSLLAILGTGLAGLLGLRALGMRRGIVLALVFLLGLLGWAIFFVSLFWEQAVVALAVAALCVLGVAVMFQRVKPSHAIRGATIAMILMFFFTGLTVQLGAVFFDGDVSVVRHLKEIRLPYVTLGWPETQIPCAWENVLLAAGVALLCASIFAAYRLRPWLMFLGVISILLFAPSFLDRYGFLSGLRDFLKDPFFLLLALLALLAVTVRLIEQPRKNTRSWHK